MKSHKCSELAMIQQAYFGEKMIGVCCQKVVEAEALVSAGQALEQGRLQSTPLPMRPVRNILVTNQIVDAAKITRLCDLACTAGFQLGVLVDCAENVQALALGMRTAYARAQAEGRQGGVLDVYVEIDVGQKRCGVGSIPEAVALAKCIVAQSDKYMRMAGIQTYHGGAQHIRSYEDRRRVVSAVAHMAREVKSALAAAGIPCPVITGGGTGTFHLDLEHAGEFLTEVQPGSFIFSDADYAYNHADGEASSLCWSAGAWRPSLFLLTQVISVRGEQGAGWVVIDSGLKAQSTDSGPGQVMCTVSEYSKHSGSSAEPPLSISPASSAGGRPSVTYQSSVGHLQVASVSDEHSTLHPSDPALPLPSLGTKLMLIPGHCDPFVNHYDWMVGVRDGTVVAVWRIASRSPGS